MNGRPDTLTLFQLVSSMPEVSMSRPLLPQNRLSAEADKAINIFHADELKIVQETIEKNRVVVVGMLGNPFVGKARKALDKAAIKYTYLGYGSYLSQWRKRLAIKLWSGWPTFPQVFVGGVLIGGANDLIRAIEEGRVK